MSRAKMRRAINKEIRRERELIRVFLGRARECRQKAEEAIRRGNLEAAAANLKLERDWIEAVERELRHIDGKMKIRDIVDEAADDATDGDIYNAALDERQKERDDIITLRRQAQDLIVQGNRLIGLGRIAQGLGKLQEAARRLARAQAETDVVNGKLAAIVELLPG